MRFLSLTALFLVFAALAGHPSSVRADDAEEPGPTDLGGEADQLARQHFLVGRSYFEQARFEEAAREFAEAHRLSRHPALLVNLGRAHERALQYEEAVAAYDRYLDEAGPHAEWSAAARERAARLRAILAERAAAGENDAAGAAKGLSSRQVWGLSFMGVGVAAGVAALVMGLRANRIHNRLDAACVPNGICPEELRDDIAQGRRLSSASWATMAMALAAGAAGLTLVLVGGKRGDREHPAADLSLGVAPGAAQATLRWRY
jgi:tetratricopeptide (TPR) repeat protein